MLRSEWLALRSVRESARDLATTTVIADAYVRAPSASQPMDAHALWSYGAFRRGDTFAAYVANARSYFSSDS